MQRKVSIDKWCYYLKKLPGLGDIFVGLSVPSPSIFHYPTTYNTRIFESNIMKIDYNPLK